MPDRSARQQFLRPLLYEFAAFDRDETSLIRTRKPGRANFCFDGLKLRRDRCLQSFPCQFASLINGEGFANRNHRSIGSVVARGIQSPQIQHSLFRDQAFCGSQFIV